MFKNKLIELFILIQVTSTVICFIKRNQILMVSFDGVRSSKFEEFLLNNPNCAFNEIIRSGVKAEYMIPSFPSLTFPNHYTLATGLNIESHGITGNSFFDPKADIKVNLIGDSKTIVNDEKWWNAGEPIWLTARSQGLKTAAYYWVGSEVRSRTPDIWKAFDSTLPSDLKIEDTINLIQKFQMDLTVLYFDEPDHEGHASGPDSPEYMMKIREIDDSVGYLIKLLKDKNIYNDLNLIVVSDHGMAQMATRNTLLIQDYTNRNYINSTRTVYGVTTNLYPINGYLDIVYNDLKVNLTGNATIYKREDMPEDLFYSKGDRIAPIVVLCDEGYTMSTVTQTNKGNHGYDNKVPSMRTIFAARGPNFIKNKVIPPFKNVDVYPLLCELAQINCNPHNGTLATFNDVLTFVNTSTMTTSAMNTDEQHSSTLKQNPILMISFDGLRSSKFDEFLQMNPDCAFNQVINDGVKAEYMIPSFPTLTFPNHYTLATGLNIESHGLTGNSFYDPEADIKVNLISDSKTIVNDAKWWNKGEPIWQTAKNQNLRTGAYFWVGSEVRNRTPDFWMAYDSLFPGNLKVEDTVNWIYKFNLDLTVIYFSEPDSEGHTNGPDSIQYMNKIKELDDNLAYLIKSLKEKNIYDYLNLIVVSDHGMAQMATRNTLLIQDYTNRNYINSTRTVYGVTTNLFPLDGYVDIVYNDLKKNLTGNATIYKKEDIPADLFYSKSDRIAPIVVICDEGYTMSTTVQTNKGNHGYSNKVESMNTIFAARGPNFKKNKIIRPFKNVDVYPLLCKLAQIDCNPNNGTLETFIDVLLPEVTTTTTTTTSNTITTTTISSTTTSNTITTTTISSTTTSTNLASLNFKNYFVLFVTLVVFLSFFHF